MASTPGGGSQRLLTMKFMQRAAASKSLTSPSTQAPTSDGDDGDHSSKRRKTGGRSFLGAPETPSYVVDQKVIQNSLEEADRKRQAAMDRMAERLGDAHWVLDTASLPSSHNQATPLKTVQVGFSEIDNSERSNEGHGKEDAKFSQIYGSKTMTKDKNQINSDSDSETDSDSDSDSENPDSDSSSEESDDNVSQSKPGRTSYGSQKRDEMRSRNTAAQEKLRKLASERRMKEVNLHKLTSISGGGVASFSSKSSKPDQRR